MRLPRGWLQPKCREALRISRFFAASTYAFPIVRATVDALKYDGVRDLAETLAALLSAAIEQSLSQETKRGDLLLVPIPLHWRRLRERGFNQSDLIAEGVATRLALPRTNALLRRTVNTKQQVKLSSQERQRNVLNAFVARSEPILSQKIIVLVDDVATTGATFREAARALRLAGAHDVWGAAVAQG